MNKSTHKSVLYLVQAAVIAALYAVLTYLCAAMNLAYGPVQFRLSEAMTILPVFTPAAIPGLAIGCFLANLGSVYGAADWVFGTLATLLAAYGSYLLRNIRFKDLPVLSALPPIVCNMLFVGFEISCFSNAGAFSLTYFNPVAFLSGALSVGAGEAVICLVLGLALYEGLKRAKFLEKLGIYPN